MVRALLDRARVFLGIAGRRRLLENFLGFACVVLGAAIAVAPTFRDLELYGGHDWDEMTAHRLLTVRALLDYQQLPLWMPYGCGGYSEWGNVVGAPNLIAASLPLYLLFELRHALRLELVLSLLISAAGCWCLAAEFTRRAALRAFVCLLFVANGRWGLQAATGHLWHLEYCYTPWAFWALERLLARRSFALGPLLAGATSLAAMVYSGGIYPLPHTVVLLGGYAALRAALSRDLRPLVYLAALGALAIGLSAPKLLPVLIEFGERPRLVASTEAIDFGLLWQALTAPEQTPGARPAPIPAWGWHEYGLYIGWAPALLLLAGISWPVRGRELALRGSGLFALALGFGAFHRFAPWSLLHELGPFRSQHVPTRWLYPALLLLGLSCVPSLERLLDRVPRRRELELVLLAACSAMAIDIGGAAALPMEHAFWMRARPTHPAPSFEQFERVPRGLQYVRRDYAPEAVPAMLAGSGVLQCNLHASLSVYAPQRENGRPAGMGARGRGASDYRGEAYTQSGVGAATVVSFSPNRAQIELRGGKVGDRLIYNQNFDPGWRVDGRPAAPYRDALSIEIDRPDARYSFEFWPRGSSEGLLVLALTLGVVFAAAWRRGVGRPTAR